jgi:2-C-methyl-D-erythritol 4-phosphate cytidylyltransferase/2-C-methyl-D-erythritol 4-phosphate cytidylyltransferase/2-C-methyl-D-erythritol 2,4-cyclodiphosphate synthase
MPVSASRVYPGAHPRFAAIITAAGSSSRMGGLKKEYCPLREKFDHTGKALTVLGGTFLTFAGIREIGCMVITIPPGDESAAGAALPARASDPLLVPGGSSRRASVHNALNALAAFAPDYVLIHDGARPWVDAALIRRVMEAVMVYKAVVPLVPLTETPKEVDKMPDAALSGPAPLVKGHLRRGQIGAAQTPQAFAYPAILRAHEKAERREKEEGFDYTDDAEIWGEFQGKVAAVAGSTENRKITFSEDLR